MVPRWVAFTRHGANCRCEECRRLEAAYEAGLARADNNTSTCAGCGQPWPCEAKRRAALRDEESETPGSEQP